MKRTAPLEVILKRDRVVVMAGILGIVALAWAYTVYLAGAMENLVRSNG